MKKVSEQLKTKAYEIGVMKLLKEVAEDGDDVHGNHTPLEICDMMLDKVDLVSAKSILVLYNIELLFALRKAKYQGHVTFFTQSTKKADLAPKILEGVAVEYIDKEANPLYYMENKWPDKFDIVIANPPFGDKRNTNLHFLFLEKASTICKREIVFVHPSNNFISSTKEFKSEFFKEETIKEIELFNGNGIFGINKFYPLSITHLDLNKNEKGFNLKFTNDNFVGIVDGICDVSHLPPNEKRDQIKGKIKSNKSLQKNLKHSKNSTPSKDFIVSLPATRGNVNQFGKIYKDDFFTFISSDCIIVKKEDLKNTPYHWVEFDTKEEAENFLLYLKTYFSRFCLSLLKFNNALNSSLHLVPWMDFTQEWTNEKLYAHFNITEDEQAFIKEIIPPYYD